jgi:hypothetical protein
MPETAVANSPAPDAAATAGKRLRLVGGRIPPARLRDLALVPAIVLIARCAGISVASLAQPRSAPALARPRSTWPLVPSSTPPGTWPPIEYVDHLHEHSLDPGRIVDGRYASRTAPGLSAQVHTDSLNQYTNPDGPVWAVRG